MPDMDPRPCWCDVSHDSKQLGSRKHAGGSVSAVIPSKGKEKMLRLGIELCQCQCLMASFLACVMESEAR